MLLTYWLVKITEFHRDLELMILQSPVPKHSLCDAFIPLMWIHLGVLPNVSQHSLARDSCMPRPATMINIYPQQTIDGTFHLFKGHGKSHINCDHCMRLFCRSNHATSRLSLWCFGANIAHEFSHGFKHLLNAPWGWSGGCWPCSTIDIPNTRARPLVCKDF